MKSIKSIIKENIEEIVIYTVIGGLGFVGMIFDDTESDYSRIRRKLNHDPIKVEYLQLNPNYDSIEDRVFSNNDGTLHQEQFGYINPKTGAIEYLTFKQIRDMLKKEPGKDLELELRKYRKDEKF